MNKRSGIFVLISFCFNSIILCVHERHPGAGWAREHSISDEYAKKRITDRHYGHLNGIYDKIEHLYDPDEEDEDGGEIASIAAREAMYGTNYTNDPAFGQHYIDQVEAKMQSVVVGESWASLGPTYSPYSFLDSGRVRCILQHPTKLDIVYVLTTGGLLKTINFFVSSPTWIPLTDQLVTTSGGYAAFGSDPETIYLGLGDPFDRGGAGGYFTKSTDGGATWSPPVDLTPFRVTDESDGSTLTRVFIIAVDRSSSSSSSRSSSSSITGSSDILLVSNNFGIYRSTDGGVSFTHPYNGVGQYYYPNIYSLVKTGKGKSQLIIVYKNK